MQKKVYLECTEFNHLRKEHLLVDFMNSLQLGNLQGIRMLSDKNVIFTTLPKAFPNFWSSNLKVMIRYKLKLLI